MEKQIRELFFIPWLLLIADFFHGSGKAAADKRGEPQEVGCAPLLRFSPFEIPFPYLPPGFALLGLVYHVSGSCPACVHFVQLYLKKVRPHLLQCDRTFYFIFSGIAYSALSFSSSYLSTLFSSAFLKSSSALSGKERVSAL